MPQQALRPRGSEKLPASQKPWRSTTTCHRGGNRGPDRSGSLLRSQPVEGRIPPGGQRGSPAPFSEKNKHRVTEGPRPRGHTCPSADPPTVGSWLRGQSLPARKSATGGNFWRRKEGWQETGRERGARSLAWGGSHLPEHRGALPVPDIRPGR